MNGGCTYPGLAQENAAELLAFERSIIQMQIQMEDSFISVASASARPSVVVFDRGLLDVPAYLPRDIWLSLLAAMGYDEAGFAARYDVVIHLVTTAYDIEDVYLQQKANNPARTETPEEARALDDKVLKCWAAHPLVERLGNETGFNKKLQGGSRAVLGVIAKLQRK
jgi:hypothetical protein